jgi:tetratricopeptide (TPR) repeat protein
MNIFKILALTLLPLTLAHDCWSLSADSLVRWNEISFATSFEEHAFNGFLKENNKDYLQLFLANSPAADQDLKLFEKRIDEILEEINVSGALKKKNEKKIKYIYDLVHSRFLIKYEAENRFYEIARTGNYNCVTATALYAMLFEKLNIPYAIKEEPTHVYLVAYPNAENILVETTTPLSGFLAFDQAYKLDFVNTLKSQKIIGSSEVTSTNIDELFNKYYFGNENITLTQLIGIHFLNDCLFKRDHDDMAGAYEQIKKAYLYYPNTRSEYLLMGFTAERLEQTNLEPINKAILIGRISRFKKIGITNEMIIGEFQNLTQAVLSKRNDKDLYKKCYIEVVRNINDTELSKEISYIYYYENGRVFYNQGNYTRAKPFFAKALEIQPHNVDLGGIFISCLGQSFRNERNNTAIVDSEAICVIGAKQ